MLQNILWISTNYYGLLGYNIDSDKLTTLEKKFFYKDWQWVTNFYEDNKNQLWLGTFNGLFVLDKERKNSKPITAVNDLLEKSKLPKNIGGVCSDGKGKIWFTINGKGYKNAFGCYNEIQNKATLYNQNENKLLPKTDDLFNITADNSNHMYIATTDGLLVIDNNPTCPTFKLLTTKDGLLHTSLQQVMKATDNTIWCSGIFGISSYNPVTQSFVNYSGSSYGIGSERFPLIAQEPKSKNIFLAQVGAFTYFNPADIVIHPAPKIIFNELKIFDAHYLSASQLDNADNISFTHDQNSISVEFAALSFSNSSENMYSWQLLGLEKNWNTSHNNIASYNNLAPGKYTLLVKAANCDGVWTMNPASLTFTIKPPFYKTAWFILFSLLTIASIIYYVVQSRIKRIKDKFQLRNKIASDLHDEIGSTITSINILSNVSQQAMDKEPGQAKEMMEQIAIQSKQVQQNMSDLVWSIRPDNEKLENLLVRMKEYTAQTLEPLQIRTSFNFNEQLTDIILPLQYRKEVLLIFKEAVNNITKHANATEVTINIGQTKNKLTLSIADNGQWKGNGNSTGTGTKSMMQRATAIGGC